MINYLIKIGITALFSLIIIYFYYSENTHIEFFSGYLPYIIIVGIIYGVYKTFQLELSNKKASFSAIKLFGFFLLHLLILSILFFHFNKGVLVDENIYISGFILFLKIFGYLLLPIFLVLVSLSFGRKIISYFDFVKEETSIYKLLLSLGLGFFSFVFFLDILGILGFYNLFTVFFILSVFLALSYREFIDLCKNIFYYEIEADILEGNYLKLVSAEFLFVVSTLVLSVSLINIVRPMPIGWDDLGVYMNFPHLMAEAGSIVSLGGMYAWQTFTGIGYMFGSPTQAFFLNSVGGILSFIVIVLIIHDLLNTVKEKKKTFVNIPFLVATIFISMPMIVFQQAKDMKLDAGLFFISIIVVYLLFKYYLSNNLEKNQKKDFLMILFIGILAGFAFTIKFTSLLLISGLLGLILFIRLGLIGLIGYLSIYFAVFTKANLWSMMNVVVNPNNISGFETSFFIISGGLGLGLLIYIFNKHRKKFIKCLKEVGVLLLGVFIAIFPWIGKNIVDTYSNLSIKGIIVGKSDHFAFKPELIYSETDIESIKNGVNNKNILSEGTSTNEDWGRYFGYEKGINNYVKLPWNLTMQVNQSGEYTDISYIFLALLPVIFLFFPYKNKRYPYFIVVFLLLELLVFINSDRNLIKKEKLSLLPTEVVSIYFEKNTSLFKDKYFGDDIFDIDYKDYISKAVIRNSLKEGQAFKELEKESMELFYTDIINKVKDDSLGYDIKILNGASLKHKDIEKVEKLRILYNSYYLFSSKIKSIEGLNENLELTSLWKENRTFYQYISDFNSKFRLPFGYLVFLIIYSIPFLFLLKGINFKEEKNKKLLKIFKYNLVFSYFYIFLWAISAFGVVWYGIVMYFSFLLLIAIGIYYVSGYKEDSVLKNIHAKLFGSIIILLIILIYIFNSVFPHSFINLKKAGYIQYKTGELSLVESVYSYHPEYLSILFHLNISEDKRKDFLSEYMDDDIEKILPQITDLGIRQIKDLLKQVNKTKDLEKKAKDSLNRIYTNISNPEDKYKNKDGIYRIGTFLKYYVSENNNRMFEDGLIFSFNDYIYSEDSSITVDRMKKLGLGYLLVDLNAATIDRDKKNHFLTNRYEKLLKTFTSDKLELVETDSICLRLALEKYSKTEKTKEDLKDYMDISGVNYESYTDEGKQINRGVKQYNCYKEILSLIDDNKIDKQNYNYLLNLSDYIEQNKDSFESEQDIINLLYKHVKTGYKALFKIK